MPLPTIRETRERKQLTFDLDLDRARDGEVVVTIEMYIVW